MIGCNTIFLFPYYCYRTVESGLESAEQNIKTARISCIIVAGNYIFLSMGSTLQTCRLRKEWNRPFRNLVWNCLKPSSNYQLAHRAQAFEAVRLKRSIIYFSYFLRASLLLEPGRYPEGVALRFDLDITLPALLAGERRGNKIEWYHTHSRRRSVACYCTKGMHPSRSKPASLPSRCRCASRWPCPGEKVPSHAAR